MISRALLLMTLLVIGIAGCSKVKSWKVPTDDPNWILGYKAGRDEGTDIGREDVCNEIKRYKQSIADDLDENTSICNWPTPETSSQRPEKR
jgi:hypothetical protein